MRLLSAILLGCLLLAMPDNDKTAAKQPVKAETKADTAKQLQPIDTETNNIYNPFTAMLP